MSTLFILGAYLPCAFVLLGMIWRSHRAHREALKRIAKLHQSQAQTDQ